MLVESIDWKKEKLSDVVQFQKGKKPLLFSENHNGQYMPYIDIEAFEHHRFKQFTDGYGATLCNPDDVIIVWDGARCGLVGIGIFGALGSTLAKLKSNQLIPKYLLYFLQTQYENINKNPRGTGLPHVNPEVFWNLEIPYPPLDEQLRIVAKLETVLAQIHTARAALDRIPPTLKAFRQSVLAAAFRGELTERDPNDEPAAALLERIRAERRRRWEESLRARGKDPAKAVYEEPAAPDTSALPELPEGWVWTTVNQIAEVRLGRQRSPDRSTGPHMRSYLRAANVTWRGLDLSDVKTMDFSPTEQEVYRLRKGDIILNEASGSVSEVGKPAIWNDELEECYIQNTLIRVRSEGPLPDYLNYHFLFDAMASRFSQSTQGIAINHLGAAGLGNWIICLPPMDEQARIVEKLRKLTKQIEISEQASYAASRNIDALEQSALAKAFRGEL